LKERGEMNMKKKTSIILLIICFTLSMPLRALASHPVIEPEQDKLMELYLEHLASGEKDLPQIEWVEESIKIYQQSCENNQQIKPTKKWLELTEAQYEADMKKVRQQINEAGIETYQSKAVTNVNVGTTFTFGQADCGGKGKSEYCDDYEDAGNFRCNWGTSSYGWADALAENTSTINIHSASTWAWVGNQIKVNGTGNARIYFNGDCAWYVLGGMSYPTWASVTVNAIVYNVTNSQEVARKTILYESNFAPLPNSGSDDFNEYIDCTLQNGKTYALKMEVIAYISAGSESSADMCSGVLMG
jgi:hypothetical protein